jgi:outer membrane protein OmpA-like peptidoglycan-associated protein
LEEFPGVSLHIGGHTCDLGSAAYNRALSNRRACSVRNYLVEKGVAKKRLRAEGFGEAEPLQPPPDDASEPLESRREKEERKQNRRVQVKVHRLEE